ncbi:MAG TPA: metal-dependent transcriptional regulator, partial [Candidatus Thermoplasmatota archaeon]|nr:metal-dependent transcriptional regulator [Candidatus Thermoplasmatota archaeon]
VEAGYVSHEPYRDIKLTARGRELGRTVVRRHRLLEILLETRVGMKHDQADGWACRMEHVIPPELELWVCALLEHPTKTPSGDPVPPGPCCGRVEE